MATKRQKEHKLLIERQQYAKLVKRGIIKPSKSGNGLKMLAEAVGELSRNIGRVFAALRESLQRHQKC
ncbi:hypothetical protein KGP40_04385 [Weissella cibaria]|uniref:hypothetical protein n=1 Tax=Weissella cibaria TaxID=137591 RepID=UPI001C1F7E3F|nr:hypothetical protein [Weissella cibaria]MBU7561153.1 hypothetical protein [Weissella cibaria]